MKSALTRLVGTALSVLTICALPSVYASTQLRIASEQMVVVPAPVVHIADVVANLSVVNPGAKATNVVISIPSGATNIQARIGTNPAAVRTSRNAGQLTLLDAAKAESTTDLTISYRLPFTDSAGISWTLVSGYPIDQMKVYVPITGYSLAAPNLQAATQTVTISGVRFRVFTRLAIQANAPWPLSVEGLPGLAAGPSVRGLPRLGQNPSGVANDIGALGNIAIIVFVILLAILGVPSASLGRKARRMPSREGGIEALYDAWIQIERLHEEGRLDEQTYTDRRTKIRAQIVALQGTVTGSTARGEGLAP